MRAAGGRHSLTPEDTFHYKTMSMSNAERCRFYQIARGSALEYSAIISYCLRLKLVDQQVLINSRSILFRIVQMLTKLVLR